MKPLLLAGDIGGTKVNIALFTTAQGLTRPLVEQSYPTTGFDSMEALLTQFLTDHGDLLAAAGGQVGAAAFGVAGPIHDEVASLTNIAWGSVDARSLRQHLKTPKVGLLNDMMAMAHGTLILEEDCFLVLNPGQPAARGNAALIAAGTGLGEALLIADGERWRPAPSEGGHVDFAPTSELQDEMLAFLRRQFAQASHGHVSYERIISGPGLFNIYRFLRETGRGEEPDWVAERFQKEDPSAVISELALENQVPLCRAAVELFVNIYGAEAGNMALKCLAFAGVFVGGGIAPKILPKFGQAIFMEAFLRKGRFHDLLSQVPVKVILEPKTPLFGAASYAAQLLDGRAQ